MNRTLLRIVYDLRISFIVYVWVIAINDQIHVSNSAKNTLTKIEKKHM